MIFQAPGIYLLQQSNLNKEIIKFITKYKNVPQSTSKKHSIIQFKFQEGLIQAKKKETKKYVIISVDTTYGENYSFNDVKNIGSKIPFLCLLLRGISTA